VWGGRAGGCGVGGGGGAGWWVAVGEQSEAITVYFISVHTGTRVGGEEEGEQGEESEEVKEGGEGEGGGAIRYRVVWRERRGVSRRGGKVRGAVLCMQMYAGSVVLGTSSGMVKILALESGARVASFATCGLTPVTALAVRRGAIVVGSAEGHVEVVSMCMSVCRYRCICMYLRMHSASRVCSLGGMLVGGHVEVVYTCICICVSLCVSTYIARMSWPALRGAWRRWRCCICIGLMGYEMPLDAPHSTYICADICTHSTYICGVCPHTYAFTHMSIGVRRRP